MGNWSNSEDFSGTLEKELITYTYCITHVYKSVVLDLAKAMHQPIHLLKGLQNFPEALGSSYHDLAGHKDQEGHLGALEAVDKARKEFRHELDLRGLHLPRNVVDLQLLEVDGKLHVSRSDYVLDLEI
jgi:hypothetical protein